MALYIYRPLLISTVCDIPRKNTYVYEYIEDLGMSTVVTNKNIHCMLSGDIVIHGADLLWVMFGFVPRNPAEETLRKEKNFVSYLSVS